MNQSKVGIEELKTLPEFQSLTPRQQLFVEKYISNGYDATAAVQAAYNYSTAEGARIQGIRLVQSPAIFLVLAIHYGDEPLEAFIKMLHRLLLRNRVTKEKLELVKLIAELRGYRRVWLPAYPTKYAEGQSPRKDSVKRRTQRTAKRKQREAEAPKPNSLLDEFKNL